MRQNGRHTHVRHGDVRATPLPARWCRVLFFFFFLVLRLVPTRADLHRLGPNRSVLGKTAETHRIG